MQNFSNSPTPNDEYIDRSDEAEAARLEVLSNNPDSDTEIIYLDETEVRQYSIGDFGFPVAGRYQ